ncbi:MAG: IS256 family transposase, partial [Candidatus Binatia bacterium]
MTPTPKHTQEGPLSQTEFQAYVREQMRAALRVTLTAILEEELTAIIGAGRYEQSKERRDQRNGSYERDLLTSMGEIADLAVPRSRQGHRTQLFERYQRRQGELDAAMLKMFVGGNSTEQVSNVVEALTGSAPSASAVSRLFHTLEAEYAVWKERPLAAHYPYVFADGTYFSVIYDGQGHKMPILAVVGINLTGEREVLGFTIGERENQQAWTDLLEQFKQRGMQQVDLWITDGNQAMLNAIALKFSTAQRQRCVVHKIQNVLGYIPKERRAEVEPELKAIFYQQSREQADQALAAFCLKFDKHYPTAVACLRRDSDACLTFYGFPKSHWKTIRTNNICERLFEEVKK